MRFDVVSVLPEVFPPVFAAGVVGRAIQRGLLELEVHDVRDHATDRYRHVDDAPFGGGPGMVLMAEPLSQAVAAARERNPAAPVLITEPWGEQFTQDMARELAAGPGLVIVCGRYEGVDDRVRQEFDAREVSIGPYVLSGGELPAMVVIDAVARLVPGVVGDTGSLSNDVYGEGPGGYPQFTRPAEWRGRRVPEVLLSGDHAAIARWRAAHARAITEQIS